MSRRPLTREELDALDRRDAAALLFALVAAAALVLALD